MVKFCKNHEIPLKSCLIQKLQMEATDDACEQCLIFFLDFGRRKQMLACSSRTKCYTFVSVYLIQTKVRDEVP